MNGISFFIICLTGSEVWAMMGENLSGSWSCPWRTATLQGSLEVGCYGLLWFYFRLVWFLQESTWDHRRMLCLPWTGIVSVESHIVLPPCVEDVKYAHRCPKLLFKESEELLSIYSDKHHGCVSWNLTFHLMQCKVTWEPLRIWALYKTLHGE